MANADEDNKQQQPPPPPPPAAPTERRPENDEELMLNAGCGRVQCRSGCICRGDHVDKWGSLFVTLLVACVGIWVGVGHGFG